MQRQASFQNEGPSLYLVATPIGNLDELTPRAIEILKSVDVIAAEDTRNTMKLLSRFEIKTKLISHHEYNETHSAQGILELLKSGLSVALVSDAGYPCISDPGALLVRTIAEYDFPIIPISGSNAALNALVASGIVPQPFMFFGFLDVNTGKQITQLNALEDFPYTIIFYESPHRIKKTLTNILEVFGNRDICLARELTKIHEEFIRGSLKEVINICEDLKGEMVIVVDGNKHREAPISMSVIRERVSEYISGGMSTSEAIKNVAKELKVSKNEVYRQIHQAN